MTHYIRFSLDPDASPTVSDAIPGVKYGILDGENVFEINGLGGTRTGAHFKRSQLRLLPPACPSKIVCVGRNYAKHAKELGNEIPVEPLIFLKPPSSLNADGDAILYPRISNIVNYEGEIGLVVGKRGRHVKAADAMDLIFGYTIINDVTARDLQKKDGQFTRGKGFDTFCCVGPTVVHKGELDVNTLGVKTYLNGQLKQDGSIQDLIFSIPVIIEFVTAFMTLEPGDLIATGTPEGVGPMEPGAKVRVEVPGIGALENTVRQDKP